MKHPFFFGYGSLVNTGTHAFPEASPARLSGWRRVWRETDLRPAAFLSVERNEGSQIAGLIAAVPDGDWDALDAREYAYERHIVTDHVHTGKLAEMSSVQIYATRPEISRDAGANHPILLSYLDVVVQGYRQQFGPKGVADFFATTRGWSTPILDDRSAPIYPRAQHLTSEEQACVDGWLKSLSAVVQDR